MLRNAPVEQGNTGDTFPSAGTNNPRAIAATADGGLSPAVRWLAWAENSSGAKRVLSPQRSEVHPGVSALGGEKISVLT